MTTIFTMALALGFKASNAWIFQGIMMLGVTSAVFWVWSRQSSPTIKISSLVVGTILFSPYAFQYDLAILAIPATWVWSEAKTRELLFEDKLILFICWFLYPVGYILGRMHGNFPIYSIILVIFFIVILAFVE